MNDPGSDGQDHAPADKEKAQKKQDPLIRNGTPNRLRICFSDGDSLVFAPLQVQDVNGDRRPQLRKLIDQNILTLVQRPAARRYEWLLTAAGPSLFICIMATTVIGDRFAVPAWVAFVVTAAILLAGAIVASLVAWRGGAAVARGAAQLIMLTLVVAISIIVPFGTAWRFGQENFMEGRSLTEMTRLLQVVFISLACMVPGLLFFLFDRQRLSTLRERFEQQIFRLDPNVTSLADVQARYGKQIDETYGEHRSAAGNRLARQGRWPIPVATIALALGWIVVLLPAGSVGRLETPENVTQHFVPQQSAVTFAFLGAYFFAINLVLRRYAQDDLRPKAYSTITVRVLVAISLGWMIDATLMQLGPARLVVAFLIGIVP
ncbi:MAG TPA: hypothetical protein VEX37_07600, partial [Thermomicrobiales bacterium]|nr:hypothetical protein [Thermomicrobiales bacterium]